MLKPNALDVNVMPHELVNFVNEKTGLNAIAWKTGCGVLVELVFAFSGSGGMEGMVYCSSVC